MPGNEFQIQAEAEQKRSQAVQIDLMFGNTKEILEIVKDLQKEVKELKDALKAKK